MKPFCSPEEPCASAPPLRLSTLTLETLTFPAALMPCAAPDCAGAGGAAAAVGGGGGRRGGRREAARALLRGAADAVQRALQRVHVPVTRCGAAHVPELPRPMLRGLPGYVAPLVPLVWTICPARLSGLRATRRACWRHAANGAALGSLPGPRAGCRAVARLRHASVD